MYPSFSIFGREIGLYGVMAVLGLSVAGFAMCREAKKRFGIPVAETLLLLLSILGGIFVGGHLLYGVTRYSEIVGAFRRLGEESAGEFFSHFAAAFGGSVYYGGMFGTLAAAAIFTRHNEAYQKGQAVDLLAFGFPLFHIFGRIGCFLGGCCYGVECSFGFTVAENHFNPSVAGVNRFPVQLAESLCNLLIFVLLYLLFRKKKFPGKLIYVYLPVYAAVRFGLEFLRGDAVRGIVFGLSTSQWISLGILVFSLVRFAVIRIRKPRRQNDA